MKNDPINPFEVGIPEEILSDLQERLTSTRGLVPLMGSAGMPAPILNISGNCWLLAKRLRLAEAGDDTQSICSLPIRNRWHCNPLHSRARQGSKSVSHYSYAWLSRFVLPFREDNSYAHRPGIVRGPSQRRF
jgi:hypothetical protein